MLTATVRPNGLNLHSSPNGTRRDQLDKGDVVELTSDDARYTSTTKWVRVKVKRTGEYGWVAERFLDIAQPPKIVPRPTPPPPAPPSPLPTREGSGFWVGLVVVVGLIIAVFWTLIRSFV